MTSQGSQGLDTPLVFRPGDSCTNQLLSLVHKIDESFDRGFEVRSIYLDVSKAFDKVKVLHEGLIFKLEQYGIEGKLLNLFKNYLSNRKQRVVLHGMESKWTEIKAGVPKGSVLGRLLFLIDINDLEDGIKSNVNFLPMIRHCTPLLRILRFCMICCNTTLTRLQNGHINGK